MSVGHSLSAVRQPLGWLPATLLLHRSRGVACHNRKRVGGWWLKKGPKKEGAIVRGQGAFYTGDFKVNAMFSVLFNAPVLLLPPVVISYLLPLKGGITDGTKDNARQAVNLHSPI